METTCSRRESGLRSTKRALVPPWSRPDQGQKARASRAFRRARPRGRSAQEVTTTWIKVAGPSGWLVISRERKVRRSESSVPPEKSPSDSLRRPAHHFAAPCPPTVFPPRESPLPSVGLSPVGPPKRPSPCGCCTDEWVLCTRPVATRATLGCSRVARLLRSPDHFRMAVVPAGRRLRPTLAPVGIRPTCLDRSTAPLRCPGDREPTH